MPLIMTNSVNVFLSHSEYNGNLLKWWRTHESSQRQSLCFLLISNVFFRLLESCPWKSNENLMVWFVLFVLICAKLLFCLFEKKSSCQLLFISIVCDKIKQQFQKSSTTAIQKRFISWLLLRQQHIDKRPENRFYIWPNHFWNGYLICFDGMWKYLKIMFEKTFVFV